MEKWHEQRCCICGERIGDHDLVLSGLGGQEPERAVLCVHVEDCIGVFLRYLKQMAGTPDDA
jgi:hypothetical protein